MLQEIFDTLATNWTFYIIILTIQQNYFSDLYPAKILNLSKQNRVFFPCVNLFDITVLSVY